MSNKPDMVNHPPHYTQHPSGVECITIAEQMNFTIGNAMKYLWRADLKNGLEDLKKAKWYIEREIARREKLGSVPSPDTVEVTTISDREPIHVPVNNKTGSDYSVEAGVSRGDILTHFTEDGKKPR